MFQSPLFFQEVKIKIGLIKLAVRRVILEGSRVGSESHIESYRMVLRSACSLIKAHRSILHHLLRLLCLPPSVVMHAIPHSKTLLHRISIMEKF